jgi:hypothetical protein
MICPGVFADRVAPSERVAFLVASQQFNASLGSIKTFQIIFR